MIITQPSDAALWVYENSSSEGTAALFIAPHDSCIVSNWSRTSCTSPWTCRWIGIELRTWIISDIRWPNTDNLISYTTADGECLTADVDLPTTTEKYVRCNSCDTQSQCVSLKITSTTFVDAEIVNHFQL